jgi:uncharacterized glyoxalase superfamily protein PhnB
MKNILSKPYLKSLLNEKIMPGEKTKLSQAVPQLPVADVEKSQAWYKEVFGFDIAWTYPDKSIGAVVRNNATIFLCKKENPFQPCINWIFSENVDLTYTELKQKQANIIEDIENKPWNLRQFAITDLDGHIFYIHHDL